MGAFDWLKDLNTSWMIAKTSLQILYGILAAIAVLQFLRLLYYTSRNHVKHPLSMRIIIQVFLIASTTCRLCLMLIPYSVYKYDIRPHVALQVILDLIPESLFWSTYLVLILLWANMYHYARSGKNEQVERRLKWFLGGVLGVLSVCIVILAVACQVLNDYNLVAEAVFLVCLSLFIIIGFIIYGYLLHRRLSLVAVSAHRKHKMLRRIKIIVIVIIICNTVHSVHLLITNLNVQYKPTALYAPWVWLSYFVWTEAVPALIIMILFRKVPTGHSGQGNTVERERLMAGPSGLQSSQEGMVMPGSFAYRNMLNF
eukprot:TRINITY_DN11049_c0_g1_i1.p1 TRINITY_DN11049_c0_g1~~TRINITY_DN11049_c0_g1_i1.p1  ORF type:complete len:313 (+),score=52.37 TRINITY_DN11049_c0_g1_i1:135-1073(+)